MRTLSLLLGALLLGSCSGSSGDPQVEVVSAWVRPAASAGGMTAGYVTIANRGSGADRLVGASSEIAGRITLHGSSNDGGIARMRPLKGGLEIGAGMTASLEPAGNHLMIEQLRRPLVLGQRVSITLRFERSGARLVEAEVRNGPAHPGAIHGGH